MPAYGLSIEVPAESFDALVAAIEHRDYIEPVSRAGANAVREHFAKKEGDPGSHSTADKLGAKRSGLFRDFHDRTDVRTKSDGFLVSVKDDRVRQRLLGGTIVPFNSKMLTIPARTEAYGRLASQIGVTLEVLYGRNGPYALAAAQDHQRALKRGPRQGQLQKSGKDEDRTHGQGGVYYWLVKSVTQKGDPTVIPDEYTLFKAIKDSLTAFFRERFPGGN